MKKKERKREDDFRRERRARDDKQETSKHGRRSRALQFKGLIPGGVEAALYGLGLLFTLIARIWDQFQLHVGV